MRIDRLSCGRRFYSKASQRRRTVLPTLTMSSACLVSRDVPCTPAYGLPWFPLLLLRYHGHYVQITACRPVCLFVLCGSTSSSYCLFTTDGVCCPGCGLCIQMYIAIHFTPGCFFNRLFSSGEALRGSRVQCLLEHNGKRLCDCLSAGS